MKIGFIGLGIMGEAMCANIARKHNDTVYGYDLDQEVMMFARMTGAMEVPQRIATLRLTPRSPASRPCRERAASASSYWRRRPTPFSICG